jgi:hypothetical protein
MAGGDEARGRRGGCGGERTGAGARGRFSPLPFFSLQSIQTSWGQGCWEAFCGTGRGSASAGFGY